MGKAVQKTPPSSSTRRKPRKLSYKLKDGRKIGLLAWEGRGAPLVLLHGFLDDASGWNNFAKTTHRPCYAIDLSGFGNSSCPTRNRISAYAEDMLEVIESLQLGEFVLVGHSFGGAVATAISERIPQQVSTLVLLAPVGFGRFALAELAHLPLIKEIARISLPLALSNSFTASTVYKFMVSNGQVPEPELLKRLTKNASKSAAGAECANEAMVASGHSARAFYKRAISYSGPVFILYGDHDRLVPKAHLKGMEAAFPSAKLTVWKNMGHHPQREKPEELSLFIESTCFKARRVRRQYHAEAHRRRLIAQAQGILQPATAMA